MFPFTIILSILFTWAIHPSLLGHTTIPFRLEVVCIYPSFLAVYILFCCLLLLCSLTVSDFFYTLKGIKDTIMGCIFFFFFYFFSSYLQFVSTLLICPMYITLQYYPFWPVFASPTVYTMHSSQVNLPLITLSKYSVGPSSLSHSLSLSFFTLIQLLCGTTPTVFTDSTFLLTVLFSYSLACFTHSSFLQWPHPTLLYGEFIIIYPSSLLFSSLSFADSRFYQAVFYSGYTSTAFMWSRNRIKYLK